MMITKWFRCCIGMLLLSILLAGCTSSSMKGTPFYSGEYAVQQGPAEDRVNLWPLLYYREPALSVLWPLMELTDEHFAFRPLMSVYGLGDSARVYNFIWPLAQFNQRTKKNRIFPLFWGKKDATVFPLYWHRSNPHGYGGVSDSLFPLWSYTKDSGGYNVHAMWPVFNVKDIRKRKGWRVWPAYGGYANGGNNYKFYLWPLGHHRSWSNGKKSEHMLLPFYYRERTQTSDLFLSLPYSSGHGSNDSSWQLVLPMFYRTRDNASSSLITPLYWSGKNALHGDAWSALLPLYYSKKEKDDRLFATLMGGYSRKGDRSSWLAMPILSGGYKEKDAGDIWVVGPLAHNGWRKDSGSSHVFPLYYHSWNKDGSVFLSLPWSSGKGKNGQSWKFLPPFYYGMTSQNKKLLITSLFSKGSSELREEKWQTVLPLYYKRKSNEGSLFITLLGGTQSNSVGRKWLLYPLLSWGKRGRDNSEIWLAAPFFHAKWGGKENSNHLLPFYYWNSSNETFLSPLAAKWKSGGKRSTLIPPLFSLYTSDAEKKDLWALGGMAKMSWGKKPGAKYLLPLIYSNARTGTFASPVVAGWRHDNGASTLMIPPALSWMTKTEQKKDLWIAGGLARFRWGKNESRQHVFPFYYANKREGVLATPLLSTWKNGNTRHTFCPPLLSWYSSDGRSKDLNLFLSLFREEWGRGNRRGHFLPFYLYDGTKEFYSPLIGWKKDAKKGFVYPLTPLAGIYTGDCSGGWLFPLASYKRKESGDYKGTILWGGFSKRGSTSKSGIFPFYGYKKWGTPEDLPEKPVAYVSYGKELWSLPACWYENTVAHRMDYASRKYQQVCEKKNGFFPLWSYSGTTIPATGVENIKGSFLLLLYDYMREVEEKDGVQDDDGRDKYTRARILWRLWHYERRNGDVSVDIFPAITYDRKKDGFKKISFLWRFFRYENNGINKKLDLLFIPILR